MPSPIMDKLSAIVMCDAYTEGFDATRSEFNSERAGVILLMVPTSRSLSSVFERVSGIITAQHSGPKILMALVRWGGECKGAPLITHQ